MENLEQKSLRLRARFHELAGILDLDKEETPERSREESDRLMPLYEEYFSLSRQLIEVDWKYTETRTEQALAELRAKIPPASWPPLCKDGPEVFNMPALKDSGIEHPPMYGICREDGTVRFVTKEEHDAWRASKTA